MIGAECRGEYLDINLCHEDILRSGGILVVPPFLASALHGGDQLHAPAALPPEEIVLGTHWIGGWVGPGAGV
jgi:hypothetical protein